MSQHLHYRCSKKQMLTTALFVLLLKMVPTKLLLRLAPFIHLPLSRPHIKTVLFRGIFLVMRFHHICCVPLLLFWPVCHSCRCYDSNAGFFCDTSSNKQMSHFWSFSFVHWTSVDACIKLCRSLKAQPNPEWRS